MEHRITVTLSEHGSAANSELLLDAFLALHPEAGPVVEADLEAATLSVTFSIDATAPAAAVPLAADVFSDAWSKAGLPLPRDLSVEINAVDAAAELERELQPA